jgi:hypothetical protein
MAKVWQGGHASVQRQIASSAAFFTIESMERAKGAISNRGGL